MRKAIGVVGFAVLLLGLGPALAQPFRPSRPIDQKDMDRAGGEHLTLGRRFYNDGRYEAARVEFEAAYELTNHSDLLHNLSLVAEKQQRWADAIGLEEKFLNAPRPADASLSQRERDEVQGRLLRLREALRHPEQGPIAVPPQLPAGPAVDRTSVPKGAIGLMAGGGVLVAVGLGLGGGSLATRAELYDPAGVFADQYDPLVNRYQALSSAGTALGVLGGVSLAVGAGWALWARFQAPKRIALTGKVSTVLVR